MDELNYSISQVDPKKTINVGSFRLNPDGTMKDKKVQNSAAPKHLPGFHCVSNRYVQNVGECFKKWTRLKCKLAMK